MLSASPPWANTAVTLPPSRGYGKSPASWMPLVQYMQDLGGEGEVLQLAWRIVNDSLRTDVCLLFPPYEIALAPQVSDGGGLTGGDTSPVRPTSWTPGSAGLGRCPAPRHR
ncbi:Cyclin-C [Chionoecetes opilio]|uniref:Cyclin-C n=1 Tax=Chionoecetes opilio TaxID=41210 RepID=A0A8J4YFT0_CHIOP|nr:Cyclin-C [Chionoecetes opilio]